MGSPWGTGACRGSTHLHHIKTTNESQFSPNSSQKLTIIGRVLWTLDNIVPVIDRYIGYSLKSLRRA